MKYVLAFLLMAGAASAQGMRDGDVALSDADMQAQVVGTTHTFFDGGRSFFSITDDYSYTYPDGGIAYGRYELRGGGVVCTFFIHGFERCDTYVRSGDRLVLINGEGVRFPVKDVLGGGAI
ncbi:MAG: hypothetical protein AAF092_05530 [Pseudomonadota bacterium]